MTSKLTPVFLCLALVIWLCGPAAAEPQGSLQVTPFYGNVALDKDLGLIKYNPVYGVRLGYYVTEQFGVEYGLGYMKTKMNTTRRFWEGNFVDYAPEFPAYLNTLDVCYNLMTGKFTPAVFFGPGWLSYKEKTRASDTNFLLNYGLALKYNVKDSLMIRGDAGQIYEFGGPLSAQYVDYFATLGVSFGFGGEKKAPVVAKETAPPPEIEEKAPVTEVAKEVVLPLDSDNDGVLDSDDKCPNTPAGTSVDARGCPVKKATPVAAYRKLDVLIYFQTGKLEITAESKATLDKLAAEMKENAGAGLIILGYADSQGTAWRNEILAADRAQATKKYLASKGLAADRMATVGMGPSDPIGDNKTPAGRAKNRRAELTMTDKKPTVKEMKDATITFAAKDILPKGYEAKLKPVVDEVKSNSDAYVVVNGYSDAAGKDADNMILSLKRANAVEKYLVAQGVAANKISTIGLGKKNPIGDNKKPAGRAKNRRAEVSVVW